MDIVPLGLIALDLIPLNQGNGKTHGATQRCFLARHLSIIALMVIARQMQDTVQHQDFYFLGGGVSQVGGVLCGDLYRDGNVTCCTRGSRPSKDYVSELEDLRVARDDRERNALPDVL